MAFKHSSHSHWRSPSRTTPTHPASQDRFKAVLTTLTQSQICLAQLSLWAPSSCPQPSPKSSVGSHLAPGFAAFCLLTTRWERERSYSHTSLRPSWKEREGRLPGSPSVTAQAMRGQLSPQSKKAGGGADAVSTVPHRLLGSRETLSGRTFSVFSTNSHTCLAPC